MRHHMYIIHLGSATLLRSGKHFGSPFLRRALCNGRASGTGCTCSWKTGTGVTSCSNSNSLFGARALQLCVRRLQLWLPAAACAAAAAALCWPCMGQRTFEPAGRTVDTYIFQDPDRTRRVDATSTRHASIIGQLRLHVGGAD